MSNAEHSPSKPSKNPLWQRVHQLLQSAEYDSAVELLSAAQRENEENEQAVRATVLAVACQICLACCQYHAGADWFWQAYQEASGREEELRQLLVVILELVDTSGLLNLSEEQARQIPIAPARINTFKHVTQMAVERLNLWQHIQNLVGWHFTPRPTEQEVPPESFERPTEPVVPEVEDLAALPLQKTETSIPIPIETIEVLVPPLIEEIKGTPEEFSIEEIFLLSSSVDKSQEEQSLPSLIVYCLGVFRVYRNDEPIQEWISIKGKSIFKYLVTHRKHPIAKEVLMELFWPEIDPDAARNNLNVAIYGLRRSFRKGCPDISHILFQDGCYLLNPELEIWVDVEAFREHFNAGLNFERRGEVASAINEYRAADALYQDEFLVEDRYEEWLLPQRQSLQDDYLDLLNRLSCFYLDQKDYNACIPVCNKILVVDSCREDAHCRLMCCYSQQGQGHLAVRQYYSCVEALAQELDIGPSQPTVELYHEIREKRLFKLN